MKGRERERDGGEREREVRVRGGIGQDLNMA